MKKILIVMVLSLIFACSGKDDDNPDNIENYRVTRYQIGATDLNNFGDDDVNWSFNFTTNILTIVNNVSGMYPQLVPSGTYNFTFENNAISFVYNALIYQSDFDLSENDTVLSLFFDLYPNLVDDEFLYTFEAL